MKFLICLFAILLLCGCSEQGFLTETHPTNYEVMKNNMKTIEIEGCEYLVYSYADGYQGYSFMVHKGNCKNPIHKYFIEYERVNQ